MASKEEAGRIMIGLLREEVLKRGCGSLKGLATIFRSLDIDFSKKIVYEELKRGLKAFGIDMPEDYLESLFENLDTNDSGDVDFAEFMDKLKPPMSKLRLQVIEEAFIKLDYNGDLTITADDLQVVYSENAEKHPKVMSGEMSVDEILRQFLDTMDTPGCPDGRVTREEFHLYYAGVSSGIDDDCYFDLTMRSCFGLPPRGHSK